MNMGFTDRGSVERASFGPRHPGRLSNFDPRSYRSMDRMSSDLDKLGIGFRGRALDEMQHGLDSASFGMDAVQPLVTSASVAVPVQFLETWMPGLVVVTTEKRLIDDLIGFMAIGTWADEEIVQSLLERTGTSQPYGDTTATTFANWNLNFVKRTNVPFELGMRVGPREEQRAARVQVDSATWKRNACANALEITRNSVGFNGYNSGNNLTYGFLNDPGLSSYQSVIASWATATFQQIQSDLRNMVEALRTQSLEMVNPTADKLTLALPTNRVDYLSVTTDLGYSVRKWLDDNYPNIRVVSAPELDLANGGANVAYMYAEEVNDGSTDDRRTFVQMVPAKFYMLGVQIKAKGYEESYSNSTAGVMCKRPFAVTRWTGL